MTCSRKELKDAISNWVPAIINAITCRIPSLDVLPKKVAWKMILNDRKMPAPQPGLALLAGQSCPYESAVAGRACRGASGTFHYREEVSLERQGTQQGSPVRHYHCWRHQTLNVRSNQRPFPHDGEPLTGYGRRVRNTHELEHSILSSAFSLSVKRLT